MAWGLGRAFPIAAALTAAIAATAVSAAAVSAAAADDFRILKPDAPPPAAAFSDNPLFSETTRADARIHSLFFVDENNGWAVGDRGAIWHTENGRDWLPQISGVQCPLRSASFVNATAGWAVGGFSHPLIHTGAGVVLRTSDGGKHWERLAKLVLPPLAEVRFVNERTGWVVGSPSAMYPSGVFTTNTGGQNWELLPGPGRFWQAGAMTDPHSGAVIGLRGQWAAIRAGKVDPPQTAGNGLQAIRSIRFAPQATGWLVGDGGLLLTTSNAGASWEPPAAAPVAPEIAAQFDFAAMSVRGPKCWIVGSPGTRVFHTPDSGRTWTSFATGQTAPLAAIVMVDERRGWVAGALGTILATSDGGRTWQRQRAGGSRASRLGFFAQAEDVPLELIARIAGNDGWLTAVEAIGRTDVELPPRAETTEGDRLREAVVACGGADANVAWRFPLRQPGLDCSTEQLLDVWNSAWSGRGLDAFRSHLVRQIRVWRPDALFYSEGDSGPDSTARRLIAETIREAATMAGDPAAFPEQIQHLGLGPWRVRSLTAVSTGALQSVRDLPTQQLAPRLGRPLVDVARTPHGLLEKGPAARPASLGLRLVLRNDAPAADGDRVDLLADIARPSDKDGRRTVFDPAVDGTRVLGRFSRQRQTVQKILDSADRIGADKNAGVKALIQAAPLLKELDADVAGWLLAELHDKAHRTGDTELASESLGFLVDRYPDHPLARWAFLRLVQHQASGEVAWRWTARQAAAKPAAVKDEEKDEEPHVPGPKPERAIRIASHVEKTLPDLFAQPALQAPLAAAFRRAVEGAHPDPFSQAALRRPERDAWWSCAAGQQWLAERRGVCPKPIFPCVLTDSKPRLDGRLDDPVWQKAKPIALKSPYGDDAEWPAEVRLAYDRQFLYWAVRCRRAPGVKYPAAVGARPRDADLSGQDRCELSLDIDRDFTTAYRLATDSRGWTAESCWGDPSWDPAWFVARAEEGNGWIVEAAIAFDQLAPRAPASGEAWALGLQRVVPGVGFQTWSQPAAAVPILEGFGFLVFE